MPTRKLKGKESQTLCTGRAKIVNSSGVVRSGAAWGVKKFGRFHYHQREKSQLRMELESQRKKSARGWGTQIFIVKYGQHGLRDCSDHTQQKREKRAIKGEKTGTHVSIWGERRGRNEAGVPRGPTVEGKPGWQGEGEQGKKVRNEVPPILEKKSKTMRMKLNQKFRGKSKRRARTGGEKKNVRTGA